MKQLLTLSALLALFGLALSFGYASPAAAQVDADDTYALFTAELDQLDQGRRGPGQRGPDHRGLARLGAACPCNGPDGNGWESHEAFVQCVSDAAQAALDEGKITQEQYDKIVERASESEIGTPGHECPTRPDRPKRPERGERPRDLGLAEACPCNGPDGEGWQNHGQFVQCVTDAAQALLDEGTISQEQYGKIVARAAQSDIGKPGHECPTRPERPVRIDLDLRSACPCEGPDGEGWGEDGHAAFVQCISGALDQALADGKITQEQYDKLLERAEQSPIGNPDHECRPQREPRPGGPGRGPGRPGRPGPGGGGL